MVGYTMSMGLGDRARSLVGGLLFAFAVAFVLPATATASPERAAQAEASSRSVVPEGAATCFERHDPCRAAGMASAPGASLVLDARSDTRLAKAPALRTAPLPDVAPHAAASLCVLFRNFRE